MTSSSGFALACRVFLALVLVPAATQAQVPGQTRAQGREVPLPGAEQALPAAPGGLADPREQMRQFIQSISAYARSQKRDIIIVVQNALALLTKIQGGDESLTAPARTYMRAIDGVLQESLFYGFPDIDKPTDKDRREALLKLADAAKGGGLKALVMDYATTPKVVDDAYRLALAKRLVPFVAQRQGPNMTSLPPFPRNPVNANPASVLSLSDVRNFAYLRDSSAYGRQDEFALKMHETNHDMLVVDVYHRGSEPLTKQAVETLKYKNLGARRLVLAYLNIGAAESYRFYWKPEWREGSPSWIGAPYPDNPDKYFVEYWQPEWQAIIKGNANSYVYGIIAQGFDGMVLDGADVYRYFEGGAEALAAGP